MAFSQNYSGKVFTYTEADQLLQGRNSKSRKLANNTYLLRGDGVFTIRLHATDIVTIHKNGTYTLNSGGWITLTTKSRLNEHAPVSISQRGGVWYMADGSLFYDGMTVGADGLDITGSKDPADYEQKLKALKKQARKYAKDFVAALQAGKIGMPSAGDCWFCSMRTQDGASLGDSTGDRNHIYMHMQESYFVPSLLVNAGRAAGYKDFQIGMMGIGGQRLFIDPENNIYKYVVNQLRKDIK